MRLAARRKAEGLKWRSSCHGASMLELPLPWKALRDVCLICRTFLQTAPDATLGAMVPLTNSNIRGEACHRRSNIDAVDDSDKTDTNGIPNLLCSTIAVCPRGSAIMWRGDRRHPPESHALPRCHRILNAGSSCGQQEVCRRSVWSSVAVPVCAPCRSAGSTHVEGSKVLVVRPNRDSSCTLHTKGGNRRSIVIEFSAHTSGTPRSLEGRNGAGANFGGQGDYLDVAPQARQCQHRGTCLAVVHDHDWD